MGPHRRRRLGVIARRSQPVRLAIVAVTLMRLQHDGGEHQRIGRARRHRLADPHAGQVGTQSVKGLGRKQERRVVRHVGRVDPGLDPRGPQVGKGRALEQRLVQIAPEGVATVHAAGHALDDGQRVRTRGDHVAFRIRQQEPLAEPGQPLGPPQPELRRHDRPARHARDQPHLVQQPRRPLARRAQFLQHPIGKGRGPHSPAREGQPDIQLTLARTTFGQRCVLAGQRLVLWLVPRRAAQKQEQGQERASHGKTGRERVSPIAAASASGFQA